MIQPIAMSTNALAATPVSFSTHKNTLKNETNNQPNYLNIGVRELSPNVANSRVGQKLDFYA